MQQYLDLTKEVFEKGTFKPAAREGMPGTISRFGYQFRHDLADGFPILTTKKVSWGNIVHELLWFLRGDTNIKYLIDNGCNIWNEDAYNYYRKLCKEQHFIDEQVYSFEDFISEVKEGLGLLPRPSGYEFGDCGKQYGWLWRTMSSYEKHVSSIPLPDGQVIKSTMGLKVAVIDQVKEVLASLKDNPLSRRHIISAWNPTTLNDMALNACHALVQFNCRPLTPEQSARYQANESVEQMISGQIKSIADYDISNTPKYYLDCQMYQRSADLFLGVPYNISSYALLTHIFCKILNMVPGEFIHSFGDVHIYENHKKQLELQLSREPRDLPTLEIVDVGNDWASIRNVDFDLIEILDLSDFILNGYDPHPGIKGKLSTGLQ